MSRRFDSYYAEARAELERYPGRNAFRLRRELLQGLIDEMDFAARLTIEAEDARDEAKSALKLAGKDA